MPKKAKELTNNINLRITDEQVEKWNNYLKENPEFSSVSHFIRWCVDEIIDGTHFRRQVNNEKDNLKKRIDEYDDKIEELLKSQRDILKIIAQKTTPTKRENKTLREYQKGILLNLLEKTPMDEEEISKIFDDLTEIDILNMLNELMEASLIKQYRNKYKVIN
ncbi:MAG: hypothetical protein ACFFDH_03290 [Promethearchaeota archaeon]